MLARPVIRAPLPGRPARRLSGFTVLDRSGHQLLVLDRTLAPVTRIPAPISDGPLGLAVSPDGSLAAFANLDRTVVTAADRTIHWQRESAIKPQGLPQTPAVYIDRDARLWLYVPDGDHIAVFDAQTGEEIDRKVLSSSIGAGEFVAHPDGVHLGLSVAQGQDGTNSSHPAAECRCQPHQSRRADARYRLVAGCGIVKTRNAHSVLTVNSP